MSQAVSAPFPKSARLLTKRDFRFHPFHRHQTEHFSFFFTPKGQARVGISISRKVLREATSRNRVRRLVREAFRQIRAGFQGVDLHVVGRQGLTAHWRELKAGDLTRELEKLQGVIRRKGEPAR